LAVNVVFLSAPGGDARPLASAAAAHGHAVTHCETASAAASAIATARSSIVALAGHPLAELGALIGLLRRSSGAGVTVLAGAHTLQEQLDAFAAGADDVFDPCNPDTLVARLAALERRAARAAPAPAEDLVANAADAIYTLTLEGYFTSGNPAAEELTGYSLSELIGMHMSRIIAPEHLQRIADEIRAKVAGEKQATFVEIEIIRADGERVPIEITSRLFMQDGQVAGIQGLARDLRPRRRLERDIAFRAALLDNVEAATYAGDMEGRVVYWNDAAAELFGYTAAEALGANVGKLLVPHDQREVAARNVEQLRAGHKVVGEYRLKKKDGSIFPAHVTNAPVFHADGSVAAIVAICIDLTERRSQEERLAGLAAIVESSNDAVIQHDLEGRIVSWNAAAERIYGYPAAEVLGQHFSVLAPENERDEVEAVRLRALEGFRVTGRPSQRVRRDGSIVDLNIAFFPVRGPDGRVMGTATVARDVTEQARADQERRRLAAIVESATEAIIGRDNERRVVSWNAAAEQLFGRTLEEVAGSFAWEIVPEDLVEETRGMAARLREGLPVTAETERVDRAGRRFPVELNAFPVRDASGAVVGSATFIRDISEKKAAERALEETRARYRAAVSVSRDAFFIFEAERGADGTITDFVFAAINPAGERLIGWNADDVMGKRLCEIIPANRTGGFFDRYMRVVETGEPLEEEFELAAADGATRWIHHAVVKLGDGVAITSRDVTARKIAEAERQQLDARYRAIVDGTPDGLFVLDIEGDGDARVFRVALINRAFSLLTGLDAERVAGRRVEEIFRGAVLENAFRRYADAIASGGTITYEEPLIGAESRWVAVTMTALFEPGGRCYRIVGSARDITERRRSRETVERLARIIESASDAVVSADLEGRIVYWNPAAERIYGYPAAEVLGKHFRMLLLEDEAEETLGRWREVVSSGVTTVRRVGRRHKAGHIINLDISLFPLRDLDGRIIGTASVDADVTEKLRYERELLERAADLEAAFASSTEGIILVRPDMRIQSFNDAARGLLRRLHGSDMQVGDSALQWVPESEHPAFVRNFEMALAGRSFTFSREVNPPGETLWWEFSFGPVRMADGTIRGVALGIRDITERKRTDEALLQAQKAESLAVLAGGIAHDFNNLLVGILGNAGLALAELSPTSPARPTIEAIETAGQRAAELARQMLAYSGRGRFVVQRIEVNTLIEEMAHLLRVSIGKGVRMNYQFERDLPPVEGDATQLRQVVMNLVVNASDAIGDAEGVISITTRVVSASRELLAGTYLSPSLRPGPYVAIDVADTGSGMDAETLSRIFDPFFTTKFTGRGLGLAAVLGIVRGHRGAIKVESEPGRGTTFRLLFPAAAGEARLASQAAADLPWRGSGTVLLVDDEPSVRAVTARALRSFGFEVLEAADGVEGVETFAANHTNIVCTLLDITMPRMGGEEALHAIRRVDPTARVLLMSGFSEDEAKERFAGRGVTGFVQKPYELPALRAALREALTAAE
jgi:PAS domain S-box-containing protein